MGRKIGAFDITKGLFILALALVVFVAACLNDKGRTETIGFPQSFAELAKKVTPAVVNISTTTTVKVRESFQAVLWPPRRAVRGLLWRHAGQGNETTQPRLGHHR